MKTCNFCQISVVQGEALHEDGCPNIAYLELSCEFPRGISFAVPGGAVWFSADHFAAEAERIELAQWSDGRAYARTNNSAYVTAFSGFDVNPTRDRSY